MDRTKRSACALPFGTAAGVRITRTSTVLSTSSIAVRGDRGGVLAGRAICERLVQHGHEMLTKHLLADDVEAAESQLTEDEVYQRDLDWLTRCDVLIAEASGSSYGVGFEVGYVLGRAAASGQRVVLMFNLARREAISRLITGNRDAACTLFGYASIDQVIDVIDRTFSPASTRTPIA